jgi:EF-P beta-lysylation protein EpmB
LDDHGFPVRLPARLKRRLEREDLPQIARQFLPDQAEAVPVEGHGVDPLDEAERPVSGWIRKYENRALLLVTGNCPVHCRYCFRRHESYGDSIETAGLEPALTALRADPGLHEVVLSGGDPLMVSNARLGELMGALSEVPHLRRLRVHTRMPVVTPSRVDGGLLELLRGVAGPAASRSLPTWLVVHLNHASELDAPARDALRSLVRAGVPTLSQSVLLRGVNDRVEALAELFESLVDLGVKPYYLHALDPVRGAAHFAVPDGVGVSLMRALRSRVSGLAVPAFVREVPGEPSKVLVEGRVEGMG